MMESNPPSSDADTKKNDDSQEDDRMMIDDTTNHDNNEDEDSIRIPTKIILESKKAEDPSPMEEDSSTKRSVCIRLDPQEEELFDILVNTAIAYETYKIHFDTTVTTNDCSTMTTNPPPQEERRHVEIRIAGGWVRDKILGLQTHDVDVVLDTLTGVQFATLVQQYLLLSQQQQQQQQLASDDNSKALDPPENNDPEMCNHEENDDRKAQEKKKKKRKKKKKNVATSDESSSLQGCCGSIGVIAANPEQSKHLETATMKINSIDVDFCNLRSEEYTESRIPTIQFGTPLEDSLRRDFTINALYYNLRTKYTEDYTKFGYKDLIDYPRQYKQQQQEEETNTKKKDIKKIESLYLRTPLDPYETFIDDPLRVLRAIRFAVRYNCIIDPALSHACKSHEIHHALHVKVSRERVGKELEGMLSGNGANPILALEITNSLKLAGSVFCIPKMPMEPGYEDQIIGTQQQQQKQSEAATEDAGIAVSLAMITSVHGPIIISSTNVQQEQQVDHHQQEKEEIEQDPKQIVIQATNELPPSYNLLYHGDVPELAHERELGWEEAKMLLNLLPKVQRKYENVIHRQQQQQQQHASSSSTPTTPTTGIDERLLPIAVFLLPFRKLSYTVEKNCNHVKKKKQSSSSPDDKDVENKPTSTSSPNRTKKEFKVVPYMFREGIKFKSKDVTDITTLMSCVDEMVTFLLEIVPYSSNASDTLATKHDSSRSPESVNDDGCNSGADHQRMVRQLCRLEAGLLLRATKELWVTTLLLATVILLRRQEQQKQQRKQQQQSDSRSIGSHHAEMNIFDIQIVPNISEDEDENDNNDTIDWCEFCLSTVYNKILEMNLDQCWKTKPLMDGKAVMKTLNLTKPGPIMATYINEQVKWMLLHPNGSIEECEQHLRYIHSKRTIETASDNDNADKHHKKNVDKGKNKSITSGNCFDDDDQLNHFAKKLHMQNT